MTKIQSFESPIKEKSEKDNPFSTKPAKPDSKPKDLVECGHFFGYLNKHQKNMPFPNECLTCARMIECLSS